MSFCSVTNADVFALTRQRRHEFNTQRLAACGPTRYFSGPTYEFKVFIEPVPTKKRKRRPAAYQRRSKPDAHAAEVRREHRTDPNLSERLKAIRALQGDRCYLCTSAFSEDAGPTVDHVVPVSRGGKNRCNVLLAHSSCNNRKADRMPTLAERDYLHAINFALANDLPSPVASQFL